MTTNTGRQHGDHPAPVSPDYRSTVKRGRQFAPIRIEPTLSELTGPGPVWTRHVQRVGDDDLTINAGTGGEATGSRTIVVGRVTDQHGRGVPNTLIEMWQANACGRYRHWRETDFPAPLDPHFTGAGHCVTDADGNYRFMTIRPGPYPWGNHPNAWRPSHIHLSLYGDVISSRLVTQMYYEGDPLLRLDPIFQAVPLHSRDRLVAAYDHDVTEENFALGYRFDIVLFGGFATPFEDEDTHSDGGVQ